MLLSDLGHGEAWEIKDPIGNLQYAGYIGADGYDDTFTTVTYRTGGIPGEDFGAHRVAEMQAVADEQGFRISRSEPRRS